MAVVRMDFDGLSLPNAGRMKAQPSSTGVPAARLPNAGSNPVGSSVVTVPQAAGETEGGQ